MSEKSIDFELKLSDFEGPIDLLDTLIKEKKMDILNLDIALITEQYLKFVQSQIATIDIDNASQYLEMALYLLNLKSKKVIPIENIIGNENNFEYERDKLIQRIIEYRKYKEIVKKLEIKKNKRELKIGKISNEIENFEPDELITENLPKSIDINKLMESLNNAFEKYQMNLFSQKKILVQELSVSEVEEELWNFLKNMSKSSITFTEYLQNVDELQISQQYIVTSFLALLDLVRYGKINLIQKESNQELYISKIGG